MLTLKQNTRYIHLIFTLYTVTLYCYMFATNEILETYYTVSNTSFAYIDNLYFLQILGYIVGSSIMILIPIRISPNRAVKLILPLHFLNFWVIILYNIGHIVISICIVLYGSTTMIIAICCILNILQIEKRWEYKQGIQVCCQVLLSLFLTILYFDYFKAYIESIGFLLITTIPLILLFYIIGSFLNQPKIINYGLNTKSNFYMIIRHIELDMLLVFTIFFVLMSIFSGYEVFSLSMHMYYLPLTTIRFIYVVSIIAPVILSPYINTKFNVYTTHLIYLFVLIILFPLLAITGQHFILLFINLISIGTIIGLLLIGNLYILTQKFEGTNAITALLIYNITASIGGYCGYITMNTSEQTLGPYGFLIAICFVLTSLIIYYVYFLIKFKLYK